MNGKGKFKVDWNAIIEYYNEETKTLQCRTVHMTTEHLAIADSL